MTPRENGPKRSILPSAQMSRGRRARAKRARERKHSMHKIKRKSVRSRDGGWGEKPSCVHFLLAAATLLVPCLGEGVEEREELLR